MLPEVDPAQAEAANAHARKGRKRRAPTHEDHSRCRNWCFTDFTCADLSETFSAEELQFRYICYGLEVCPDTGRRHHQGWCQFGVPVSFTNAKRRLGLPGCHIERMRGSCSENEAYVTKDGVVKRFGEFVSMGERVDIHEMRLLIASGVSQRVLADSNFPLWCRYNRAFQLYGFLQLKHKWERQYREVSVVVLAGRTRCGKTRLATKYGTFIIGGYQLNWWDGYDGEKCIIIDDFADDVDIQHMLRILDGNFLRLDVKGAFTVAQWTRVIITTNLRVLYSQAPNEHVNAFSARVTKLITAHEPGEEMPDVIAMFEEVVL